MLFERDGDMDSAGALLYESAKQCLNAVANQRGSNPGPTGAKRRFLLGIAEQEVRTTDLMESWQAAAELHIHADRGHLTPTRFIDVWSVAQTFIDQMLLIYAHGG